MATPYIPPKDSDLLAWATNFDNLITATPAVYGLVAADATAITAVVAPYQAAQAVVDNPATKTSVTVAAKNTAKQAMLAVVRVYAQTIAHNAGVTDADKLALGLNLPNTSPSPIPAPTSSPILTVIGATPGQLTIRFADSNTPDKRSKPQGVTQMQLFVQVSTTAGDDPADASFYAAVTKQPFAVDFEVADAGKIATLWARWQTRTGLTGPFSLGANFVIPGQ
jgi:hypothetical protein